jgi:thiamine pyrophosphokinase
MGTALVFPGGDPVAASALEGLPPPDLVVAADSGVEHALALGCAVDLVVGDLDSADPGAVARAEAAGAVVERHPAEKDATDLELALDAAHARDVDRIIVVGGGGGRLDHFLANALVLASQKFASTRVEARISGADVVVIHSVAQLSGRVGDLCSLLPLGGPARSVRTEGLRYPLFGEDLLPGTTRGVSNEFAAPTARVVIDGGVLLAVHPHARKAGS